MIDHKAASRFTLVLGMLACLCLLTTSNIGFCQFKQPIKTGQTPAVLAKNMMKQSMNKLYVYEFMANWCPNCAAVKPMMQDIARRYNDKVQVVVIDTDDAKNSRLSEQFSVESLPTIVVIRPDGTVATRLVGRDQAAGLEAKLSGEIGKL